MSLLSVCPADPQEFMLRLGSGRSGEHESKRESMSHWVVLHGCGSSQSQWYHVGIGAPPILVYFSGDWDVHWGYGVLTHDPWPHHAVVTRSLQFIRLTSASSRFLGALGRLILRSFYVFLQ